MIVSYKIKVNLKDGNTASIIDKTDPVLFALFMILYASSTITFTFMITGFFKKVNLIFLNIRLFFLRKNLFKIYT